MSVQSQPDANARLSTLEEAIDRLLEENAELRGRVDDLEEEGEKKDERIDKLEVELEEKEQRIEKLEANDTRRLREIIEAKDRIAELQSRELEKGAHLLSENVSEGELDVAGDRLEKLRKEDGEYIRIPEIEDPLDRGGTTRISYSDLLPIQQLSRMDDDLLQSSTSDQPSRLAAKLWHEREEDTRTNPWQSGSGDIREYLKSSDIKTWIFRQEEGISDEYAKKLASRTISRLLTLSNNRVSVTKKDQRKNGLNYKERFVEIKSDAEIPGEKTGQEDAPETAGVLG